MANWEIIGHDWVIDYLSHSVARDHGAHAYLFSGPEGIGKQLLALRLAQRLVCEHIIDAPCLHCRACRRVAHGNHPDVRWTSLSDQQQIAKDQIKSRELKIDTVRAWQQDIGMRPFEAQWRVFILDDAETLTEQAANGLLKTLEEPPSYAVLILIAQGSSDLLPTIVSRCRVLKLWPLSRQIVTDALVERFGVTQDEAALVAAWSGGRIGVAIRMLEQPDQIERQQERLDALLGLNAATSAERLKWAEVRAKEYRGDHAEVVGWLQLWQNWWRDVLLLTGGCPEAITYLDRRSTSEQVARQLTLPQVQQFVTRLADAQQQLAENVNPQLVLEHIVLHLPV